MYEPSLVVIGGSAGGLEALRRITGELPPTFPAAIIVVIHYPVTATSVLPEILSRSGALPAAHVIDGEAIVPGRIAVAPPGKHVMVEHGRLRLGLGPYENLQRPSIDVLFRTAAHAFGPRTVGIVVSGMLDDGTAGLRAIVRHDGTALVQEPDDAMFAEMPRSAMQAVRAARVMTATAIGAALPAIVETLPAARSNVLQPPAVPVPTRLSCPDCGGPLEEYELDVRAFRCRVGHAYTIGSLAHASERAGEASLWMAIRANDERAELLLSLAKRAEARDDRAAMESYFGMAHEAERTALRLREIVAGHDLTPP